MRPAKCEAEANAEARHHKAKAEVEAKVKKICDAEAELCESEVGAEARDAVLTINY